MVLGELVRQNVLEAFQQKALADVNDGLRREAEAQDRCVSPCLDDAVAGSCLQPAERGAEVGQKLPPDPAAEDRQSMKCRVIFLRLTNTWMGNRKMNVVPETSGASPAAIPYDLKAWEIK